MNKKLLLTIYGFIFSESPRKSMGWKGEKLICPKTGKMFVNFWSSYFFLFVKKFKISLMWSCYRNILCNMKNKWLWTHSRGYRFEILVKKESFQNLSFFFSKVIFNYTYCHNCFNIAPLSYFLLLLNCGEMIKDMCVQ